MTALALSLAIPSAARAQTPGDPVAGGPPPPGEPRPFSLPELTDVRLDNGARLLVVPNREVPLVTVDVVLPGGQATDPDGLEGVSILTASLLESGTSTRTYDEIVGGLDRIGVSLDATADADWTRISLVALTDVLDPALEIMADVIADPIFPEARLETLRRQAMGALATQRSQPPALARRVMLREVYGAHPYGKQTTETTLGAIDREALLEHHARWYRPGSALVVVAGDVDPDDIERRLNEVFGAWRAGSAPNPAPRPVSSADRAIVLVHQPGAVQAEIRIGYALPPGGRDDWTAVEVAAHHLGSTPSGLLNRNLRETRGWTYSATATAERRVESGVLEIAFATRNDVAVDALGEAMRLIDEVGGRAMADDDFDAAIDFLAGVVPLRSETPHQIADRVSRRVLLGLDPAGVERVDSRLRGLVPGEVRRAFAEAVDSDAAAIVVVGDATLLQAGLSAFGDVRIEGPDGTPLTLVELMPAERSTDLSAIDLVAGTYRYRVTLQGQPVGTLIREIVATDGERVATSELTLGPQTMSQSVTFGAERFDFRESSMALEQPGFAASGEIRRDGVRLTGYMDMGAGREPIDMEVPGGVLVSDMLEMALWVAELDVGAEFRFPVASVSNGTVTNAVLRVEDRTTITVPAGTFDVFRVEVEGTEQQTIWVRVEAPHVPVRVAPGDQPIIVELAEITGASSGSR
jgi:predicted Zn-dependent peptidase